MSVEKAKGYYLNKFGTGKLNCSQAVVAAFKNRFSIDEKVVASFAGHGSGQAPDGVCGALFAAKFLLKDKYQDRIKEFEETFLAAAGSIKCKEIRKLNKLSCVGCVEKAAEFIEKTDRNGNPSCSSESGGVKIKCGGGISVEGQVRLIAGILVVLGTGLAWLVHWAFIAVPLFVGCGLIYAGLTDNCLMGIMLMKMRK